MLGTVRCLGKESQRIVMLEHLDTFGDYLFVLFNGCISVADTEDGQHLEEGKGLKQQRAAEDVGTGHEDGGTILRTQDGQRIEQGAGMVATDNNGTILGQVLLAFDHQSTQRHVDDRIDYKATENCIDKIFVIDLHSNYEL
jgi:hypothetical protein